jgi:hypothetical protein
MGKIGGEYRQTNRFHRYRRAWLERRREKSTLAGPLKCRPPNHVDFWFGETPERE